MNPQIQQSIIDNDKHLNKILVTLEKLKIQKR